MRRGYPPAQGGCDASRKLRLLVDHREDLIAEHDTVVARIALDLIERIRALTIDINALEAELDERTTSVAPRASGRPSG